MELHDCIILGLIILGAATYDNFLIFLHSLHSFKYFENVLTVWISHTVPNNVIMKVLTCLKEFTCMTELFPMCEKISAYET